MRLLLTLCLGLCIIALQVVLGAKAFFPDAFADKTDVVDALMEQKKSVLDQIPPAELAWITDHPVVIAGVDPNFYPLEMFDERGRYTGLGGDYLRLLAAAKGRGNWRLYYLMETLASTGVRVSELQYVTVQTLRTGRVWAEGKGKGRLVLLTPKLCRVLAKYCRQRGIATGPVFVTRTGRPMDRSNIWKELHHLCEAAGVEAKRVFPHNFRHLFAQAFYALEKDIAKLADLLGHASVETTRIYIMESGAEHRRQVERLGLVV